MLPVVALVGRPNVGKSTLFNRLTRTRDAVISAVPGTTRDRQYGDVHLDHRHFIIIDTGGLTDEVDEMGELITQQAEQAIQDADIILFLVDAIAGMTPEDNAIAERLRRANKPIVLAVNKTEGLDPDVSVVDAFELRLATPIPIAAVHGHGITRLVHALMPEPNVSDESDAHESENKAETPIKFAIVGRPNVGKSTLANRILGEERQIVHDSPGTTRDSIYIPLTRPNQDDQDGALQHYTMIDTAGVRKRKKTNELPEKFSVVKTLQAIEDAHVVVYVIDARVMVSEQDLKLLGFILDCGRALVLAINKWDGLSETAREQTRRSIDRQLDFVSFARIHMISALHGSGVGNLFQSINEAYRSATKKLATPQLTRLLQQALVTHSPPLVKGRRVKLRYAHVGGHNPPRIIIHGTQVDALPLSYRKFLAHFYQTKLALFGTPVRVEFKATENPYA